MSLTANNMLGRLFAAFTVALAFAATATAQPKEGGEKAAPKREVKEVKVDGPALAGRVKEIFRTHCAECHNGPKANGGIKVLDHKLLIEGKKVIVPGKPDTSELFKLVSTDDDSMMPPEGQPRMKQDDIDSIREWIAAGAPAFPGDVAVPVEEKKDPGLAEVVGVDSVNKKILDYIRSMPGDDRPYLRFFTTNHLLHGGATRQQLDLHRDALAKAINHLSLEKKIVRLKSIDSPTDTVFVVDIRRLGWQKTLFKKVVGKSEVHSRLTLFDLALLEYPYAVMYEDSETYDRLINEFVQPSGMVRPVIAVRADWFASVATLPPLYDDFLQIPHELSELEERLKVNTEANIRDGIAQRAAMTVSGVSRNNRAVERHEIHTGAYWKSLDFATSKGQENIFKNPIEMHPAGGEMVFSLPNGLNGYMITLGNGRKLDFAPTEIVTDKFAEDKTVRNGLSCIRCHDKGIKHFTDNVRPALERLPGSLHYDKRNALALYPKHDVMDALLKEDTDRFQAAMTEVLGREPTNEPLTPVSQRFLEGPIQLTTASAELGLPEPSDLRQLVRQPQFAALGLMSLASGGVVRRDMWEDYYDQVVRALGLGIPVIAIDGLSRPEHVQKEALDVELSINRKNNIFASGDKLVITVTNKSHKPIHYELIGRGTKGEIVVIQEQTTLEAGGKYSTGEIGIQPSLGKETVTVFASEKKFPAGELLIGTSGKKDAKGNFLRDHGVTDRFVHGLYHLPTDGPRSKLTFDPATIVKKSITFETR